MQHEQDEIQLSCDALAPELDFSPMGNPGASPESLVDAVWNLKLSLSNRCRLLEQKDLKIVGICPIDAGGFADVWVGEVNGTTAAVKSYRCYTSSTCLPTFLVSDKIFLKVLRLPKTTGRGCTGRR